ncbi:MAG: hypothetical protein PHN19_04160 [Patescibacteria group bacterium]|nr:hypothetical protein [Patescibacteria group bacterium]
MEKLTKQKLVDYQTYTKILKQIQQCANFFFSGDDAKKAFQIYLSIHDALEKNPSFQEENPEMYQKYHHIMIYLKFNVLDFLYDNNDILDLFQKHTKDALVRKIDLEKSIRSAVNLIQLPFRDDFLTKILASIKKNQQKIGTKNIILGSTEVQPTIQNWIKDYEYTSEPGIHSLVERNSYFIHSQNIRKLNEAEKKQVKILLQFYDKLHLKVTDVGGLGSYPIEMYDIKLKKPVAVEDFTTKELQKVNKSVNESAGTVRSIPFPTPKTEKREKILAENKKMAEQAMKGAIDIKKLEAEEPANKFIASLKNIGKPKKAKKIESEAKVIKALPEKQVVREITKPKVEEMPNPPAKVFHKEHKVLTPTKPVSKEINKIQNISIVDFKKLGATAKEAAQALLTKIREVAKTHDERKIAQENFMKSPLFKLYEAMENQSSSEKKSISQIGEDRKKQGTEFLTEDEYIAVKSISKLI